MSDKALNYLKRANNTMQQNPIGEFSIMGLRIYIKEPVPEHVNIRFCLSYVLEKMPRVFFKNVARLL